MLLLLLLLLLQSVYVTAFVVLVSVRLDHQKGLSIRSSEEHALAHPCAATAARHPLASIVSRHNTLYNNKPVARLFVFL